MKKLNDANIGILVLLSTCLCLFSCNNDNDNLPKDYAGFEHSKETVECEGNKSECELEIKIVAMEKAKEDRTVVLAAPPPVPMNTWKKLLIISGMCSLAGVTPAFASTNLETGSSLAGISVALNNYYAGNAQPEKKLASSYNQLEATETKKSSETKTATETKAAATAKAETKAQTSSGAKTETKAAASTEVKAAAVSQTKAASSAYDNIAVSKVSGSVNIRTEANTSSSITGKIYNDCAATILDTVDGEGGKWYKIQSGSVTGYIKSEYFVTGQKAETKAKEVGK